MRLPESPGDAYLGRTNHSSEVYSHETIDLVPRIPFCFGDFLVKQKLECDKAGENSSPDKLAGTEVHPDLKGIEFELYIMPWGKYPKGHYRNKKGVKRYLIGIKFTGQPTVDWAKYLQEVVLECEGVDEAKQWLKFEADIRLQGEVETPEIKAFKLEAERNMAEIIEAIRQGPAPKKKSLRPGRHPAPRPATV